MNLDKLSVQEVLLGVFDGLSRLEETMIEVYTQANVQHYGIHKVRNTLNLVRRKEKLSVAIDLKLIYKAHSVEDHNQFSLFMVAWKKKYRLVLMNFWSKLLI